ACSAIASSRWLLWGTIIQRQGHPKEPRQLELHGGGKEARNCLQTRPRVSTARARCEAPKKDLQDHVRCRYPHGCHSQACSPSVSSGLSRNMCG
ncbi:unnamed protein product, partial [Ectocarpus sp. 6 AP-2014]